MSTSPALIISRVLADEIDISALEADVARLGVRAEWEAMRNLKE